MLCAVGPDKSFIAPDILEIYLCQRSTMGTLSGGLRREREREREREKERKREREQERKRERERADKKKSSEGKRIFGVSIAYVSTKHMKLPLFCCVEGGTTFAHIWAEF